MRHQSRHSGLTLLEMVIVMGILSGIMIFGASTIMGFAQRFTADIQLDRAERAANRLMAEFAAATESAASYAIYDNVATWKISSATTQGDFILLTRTDGSRIGFAYVSGEVQIIHDPAGVNQVLICNRSVTLPAGKRFAFMDDGVPALAWTVNLPTERAEFRVCAYPLQMQ